MKPTLSSLFYVIKNITDIINTCFIILIILSNALIIKCIELLMSIFYDLYEKQLIWNIAFLLKFSWFCNNWNDIQQYFFFLVKHNQECKKIIEIFLHFFL